MMIGIIGLLLFFYPIFNLFLKGNEDSLLFGQLGLAFLIALLAGPLAATTAESFTTATRYTGVAAGINIGATLFGGTAPLVSIYLVREVGNPVVPCLYPIIFALACLFVICGMKTDHKQLLT